uniref:steroid 11beta-monooxygenase n=1 Tax=Latimeria chalumnae TaxID=7897 RepID=H3B0K9_LATCH
LAHLAPCQRVNSRPLCDEQKASSQNLTSKILVESVPGALPYHAIPSTGKNGWLNLLRFWKNDEFRNFHHVMLDNFKKYGPIYSRERIGKHESVNILFPEDIALLFRSEGLFPRRRRIEAWVKHRQYRNHSLGIFLKNDEEWRTDRLLLNKEVMDPPAIRKFLPLLDVVAADFVSYVYRRITRSTRHSMTADISGDLFRYALELIGQSCHVLYGERLGLLDDNLNAKSQQFFTAIEQMLSTTVPMLYIPPSFLKLINAKLWRDHIAAWDVIFEHADVCIHNIYNKFRQGPKLQKQYSGILAELLLQAKMPLNNVKANVTELMAGSVDTTAVPLLFMLFELARNPSIQADLREEIVSAYSQAQGDMAKILNTTPLLKAAIKETLRMYPVGIMLQRYLVEDLVLQNYHVPAGTLVQVGLYPMGRSPDIFSRPEQYQPERWLTKENNSFKALAFGFGTRQCIGRRIAELEMQLFLIHV